MIDFGWYMTPDFELVRVDVPTELKQYPAKDLKSVRHLSFRESFDLIADEPSRRVRLAKLRDLHRRIHVRIRADRRKLVEKAFKDGEKMKVKDVKRAEEGHFKLIEFINERIEEEKRE